MTSPLRDQLQATLGGNYILEREIQVAAALPQASIVPVLSAGDTDSASRASAWPN